VIHWVVSLCAVASLLKRAAAVAMATDGRGLAPSSRSFQVSDHAPAIALPTSGAVRTRPRVEIAPARGKARHDKRQALAAADAQRDMDRAMKGIRDG